MPDGQSTRLFYWSCRQHPAEPEGDLAPTEFETLGDATLTLGTQVGSQSRWTGADADGIGLCVRRGPRLQAPVDAAWEIY